MLKVWVPTLASFFVTVLAIVALRPLAVAVDLIDRPGGRKTHHGEVPIVGGLAMFLGLVVGIGLLPAAETSTAFLAACAILVVVGLMDDRFDLSPWARLPVQIAAVVLLMSGAGAMVTSLGAPLGGEEITFTSYGSYAFTILITISAINAFNMLDGMDGLAGAVALVALTALASLVWMSGSLGDAAVGFVIAGAVVAFLHFNLPVHLNHRMRCFMGDAGSTLLGFAVAWLCIKASQGPARVVSPIITLWIVALPLFELTWTTVRRLIRGISPFKADNEHFHHLLLRAGFGVRGAFAIYVVLAILLATFGVLAHRSGLPEPLLLALLVVVGIGVVRLMYRADVLIGLMPVAARREKLPKSSG